MQFYLLYQLKVTRLVAKQVKEVLAKLKQRPMVIHASKGLGDRDS